MQITGWTSGGWSHPGYGRVSPAQWEDGEAFNVHWSGALFIWTGFLSEGHTLGPNFRPTGSVRSRFESSILIARIRSTWQFAHPVVLSQCWFFNWVVHGSSIHLSLPKQTCRNQPCVRMAANLPADPNYRVRTLRIWMQTHRCPVESISISCNEMFGIRIRAS